jgi:hypothetical protein
MKSERWIYSLGILTVLFLMAFENIFNLRKEQTSLDLPLKNIKELAVNFDCEIFVNKGEAASMIIEGDKKLLSRINPNQNPGTLKLDLNNNLITSVKSIFHLSSDKPRIYISHNTLQKLQLTDKSQVISSDFAYDGRNLVDRELKKLKMKCPKAGFTSCIQSLQTKTVSLC